MSAIFSPDGVYRCRLDRPIRPKGAVVAILGVNPSTADAEKNDHTITKDVGFGTRRGWSRLIKGNKFAFKATDVRELRTAVDPVGPDNDFYLTQIIGEADIVIAAWGPLAKLPPHLHSRYSDVEMIARRLGKSLHCFGVTKDGQPRHTLMLAYDTPLIPWDSPL